MGAVLLGQMVGAFKAKRDAKAAKPSALWTNTIKRPPLVAPTTVAPASPATAPAAVPATSVPQTPLAAPDGTVPWIRKQKPGVGGGSAGAGINI